MQQHYDLILVGAGLANGLIALRLQQQHPDLALLLIESDAQAGGNHTWSFHEEDLSPEQHRWIAPLIVHRWSHYHVRFPQRRRQLNSGYFCVTSQRFADLLTDRFGARLITQAQVSHMTPETVRLADGRTFSATAVIDGRGYLPDGALLTGFQAFVGQEWQLQQPHGLTAPIIMDATVDQQNGYRFVYTLPLSATTLLIEDTHYIDNALLEAQQARQHISAYAAQHGWQLEQLIREEQGALPITLAGEHKRFWQHRQLACSGLRAGLFHPTTGYSLPLAVALADHIADSAPASFSQLHEVIKRFATDAWRRQGFFRMLNRMLFLAGPADQRWKVMQRFYGLPESLIARFYAGKLTLPDMARILSGKPPVPVMAALQAVLTNPSRLRAMR